MKVCYLQKPGWTINIHQAMDCLVICQDAMKIDWDDWKSWMRLVSTQTARKRIQCKEIWGKEATLGSFFPESSYFSWWKKKMILSHSMEGWVELGFGVQNVRWEWMQPGWKGVSGTQLRLTWEVIKRSGDFDWYSGLCWPSCIRSSWNKKYVRISNNHQYSLLVVWSFVGWG